MSDDFTDSQQDCKLLMFKTPEYSEWECKLFGSGSFIVWRPLKGKQPNWFWRKMQFLIFGNKWEKVKS